MERPRPWPLHPLPALDTVGRSAAAAGDGVMPDDARGPAGVGSGGSAGGLSTFASKMREQHSRGLSAFGPASPGSPEPPGTEDSCYSKRLSASTSLAPGADLVSAEPEEDTAPRCFACLPKWGARKARSRSYEAGDSSDSQCPRGRSCGESRSEGRRRSFWGHEEGHSAHGDGEDGPDPVINVPGSASPTKGLSGRLRDLEEGLRSLAVSHSHLKLEHGGKLDELEGALARVVHGAREEDERSKSSDAMTRSPHVQGAALPPTVEAALRQELMEVKAELESAREETQKRMMALEAKWSLVSEFESKWRLVAPTVQAAHLAAQDAGMQAAAAHESAQQALQRDPIDAAGATSSSKMLRLAASPAPRPLNAAAPPNAAAPERGDAGTCSVLKSGRLQSAHGTPTPRVLPVSTPKAALSLALASSRNGGTSASPAADDARPNAEDASSASELLAVQQWSVPEQGGEDAGRGAAGSCNGVEQDPADSRRHGKGAWGRGSKGTSGKKKTARKIGRGGGTGGEGGAAADAALQAESVDALLYEAVLNDPVHVAAAQVRRRAYNNLAPSRGGYKLIAPSPRRNSARLPLAAGTLFIPGLGPCPAAV